MLGGGLKDAGWQREHMSQNRLAILPDVTHYELGVAPQLIDAALPFLDGQARARSWDEQPNYSQRGSVQARAGMRRDESHHRPHVGSMLRLRRLTTFAVVAK